MKNKWLQITLSVLSLGLAVLLVVYLPQIVRTLTGKPVSWHEIGKVFGTLGPGEIALMTALWLLSLLAYTFVLTNSLPGLNNLQGLTLNAAGSAVSNLLPFGGAVGVAVSFAMTRGWGFSSRSIVVMTLVSGIWNTMFRFILPAVGIIALLAAGEAPNATVAKAGWTGAISILVLCVIVAVALYWDRAAVVLGRALDGITRLLRLRIHASDAFHKLRADTAGVVRSRWAGLSLGMVFFLGFQWAIMAACLQATGAWPGFAQSIAVFALSRVLTSVLITPSGAGIMEGGVVLLLTEGFGVGVAPATATALLFGFWTYTIEIPFGGLALGAWALLRRRNGRNAGAEPPSAISKAQ
ncbi:lysylphosphatidylglycerol synthase transmembrane domain-containing protein [Nonomuraea angiospora]|uniref:lysylphosphatidylglycerol synthase transmembrane domain-containing protein n=1 Tax=Nonomuraea angiospora TaxID=46172 RepID=UPI0029BD62D5|nr:lysylphosphatidylglycerol synthase domain-containing protein [Nonomuraea angiospora]MDX3104928.1 lysylphosphatidylglycerol synthase domain-containing protein [Nonomuraea angiospora]